MENLIIICIVGLAVFVLLWDTIKVFIGILAILFALYLYADLDSPRSPLENLPGWSQEVKEGDIISAQFPAEKEQVTPEKKQEKGQEEVLQEIKTRVEIHHYFHGSSDHSLDNIPRYDTQKVSNSTLEKGLLPREVPQRPKELDYCENVEFQGKRYFLQEGIYESAAAAMRRLAILQANQIKGAKIIWLPCYKSDSEFSSFSIILGRACRSQKSIQKYKEEYEFEFYSANLMLQEMKVVSLEKRIVSAPVHKKTERLKSHSATQRKTII